MHSNVRLKVGIGILCWLLLGGCALKSVTQSTQSKEVLHVVLLQFKPGVTAHQINAVVQQSLTRLRDIPGVIAVDAGHKLRDDRPVHIKHYDVGILVRMQDAPALDAYGSHPLHQAFVSDHQALFAGIQVIDFASEAITPP